MDKTYLLTVEPGLNCIFDREPTNSQHRHAYWEVCLVFRGSGEYIEEGHVTELVPGDLFVSPPDRWHEIRSLQTRDLELFFVSFTIRASTGAVPDESDDIIDAFSRSHSSVIHEAVGLLPYIDLINGARSLAIRDQLARLFTLEAMEYLSRVPRRSPVQKALTPEVQRALRFIDDHCTSPLTVPDVAHHVNLAPRTLLRKFLQQVGHSVSKEIRQRKMRKAAHRLLMGYSVSEVGESIGIVDSSQFSAAFLAEIGVRPKVFQQTYLPGNMRQLPPSGSALKKC